MMDLGRLEPLLHSIAQGLRSQGWRIGTAESCTGGLIAAACTALPGSSDWFERSVVSYSNEAKTDLLGVPPALIGEHGAVSEAVARAMAEGLLARAPVQFALAVTGIAGPGGAVPGKPAGTVWLALASRLPALPTTAWHLQLDGDRGAVRARTVELGLQRLLDAVERAAQGVGRSTGSSEG